MANKMLIDATHPEETRVVVVRGNRVEEFDYESASRKQLRGNIYLAKVTRVEPSLQAAFVEYGGNRHGFLAFSEIHPDYYQIPVADRLALIEEEERAARLADDEAEMKERRRERSRAKRARPDSSVSEDAEPVEDAEIITDAEIETDAEPHAADEADELAAAEDADAEDTLSASAEAEEAAAGETIVAAPVDDAPEAAAPEVEPATEATGPDEADEPAAEDDSRSGGTVVPLFPALDAEAHAAAERAGALPAPAQQSLSDDAELRREAPHGEVHPAPVLPENEPDSRAPSEDDEDEHEGDVEEIEEDDEEEEEIEHLGADDDALEEVPERASQRRARSYKIQEVIRRRQVMLVQVVKEERGNKGAALTTYLSLAGRYSVLMPNTARGGGISRKITNAVDRKRLKEVVQDLEVPEGMGIILRTAGANRTKVEIKRDFEYLLRLWETVRELTLSSAAPSLVYEEGSLIKRAIRDLYNKEIEEVLVAGEDGYKEAKDFMRMLMPSHAKQVLPYRESQPIFARYGVEQQLDAMFSPVVQLKSGGYIVINPTEALVSIDVNSGRATREHHIEDTALKTNLEAAEEIARQLRLRDLAGLIVIDFIDMEEKRNNRSVERKLKDCLKNDRARIQIGRISHFGLLEMSRQRIRTGVLESSIEVCPHCGGTGHVRSAASVSLQLLRALEEQLLRSATHNLIGRTRTEVALYVLNQKRAHLYELEERFGVTLDVQADDEVTGHQPFVIEKGEPAVPAPVVAKKSAVVHPDSILPEEDYPDEEEEEAAEAETDLEGEAAEGEAGDERADDGKRRRRRRRRRRPGEREDAREGAEGEDDEERGEEEAPAPRASDEPRDGEEDEASDEERGDDESGERRRRRRGRRGGRRNRRDRDENDAPLATDGEGEGETDSDEAMPAAEMAEGIEELTAEGTVAPEASAMAERAEAGPDEAELPASVAAEAPVAETVAEAPLAAEAEPAAPATEEPEAEARPRASRRRSTVREKAPIVIAEDGTIQLAPADEAAAEPPAPEAEPASEPQGAPDAPAPAEAAPEPAQPGTAQKPRSGWWQRKFFGG